MPEDSDPAQRFLPRIRRELAKLPLTDEQRERLADSLLENAAYLDSQGVPGRTGKLTEDSSFFDLAPKVQAIVAAFEADGLTPADYLGAVVRQPQLLNLSPAAVVSNARGAVEGLSGDGLTVRAYLKAAMKQPSLLWSAPDTVRGNIEGVVERFSDEGLTAKEYLKAVVAQPSLFHMSPATVEGNLRESAARLNLDARAYLKAALKQPPLFTLLPATVEQNIRGVAALLDADGLTAAEYARAALKQPSLFGTVPETAVGKITGLVERFAAEGLTVPHYLRAAIKQPSLFATLPETVAGHVTGVVERHAADGMTTRDYLKAALKHPSLFTMSPETVSRHIDTVLDFADRGIFQPPVPRRTRDGRAVAAENVVHARVIDFLLRNPNLMCLADDNYGLREAHQRMTDGPTDAKFLKWPRHRVERSVAAHLGHDLVQPVEADGFVAGVTPPPTEEQARRFVLRALIHAGYIKGGSIER